MTVNTKAPWNAFLTSWYLILDYHQSRHHITVMYLELIGSLQLLRRYTCMHTPPMNGITLGLNCLQLTHTIYAIRIPFRSTMDKNASCNASICLPCVWIIVHMHCASIVYSRHWHANICSNFYQLLTVICVFLISLCKNRYVW